MNLRCLGLLVGAFALYGAGSAAAAPSVSSWAVRDRSQPEAIASGAGSPNVWFGEYETPSAVGLVTPAAAPPDGLTEYTAPPAFSSDPNGFVTALTVAPDGNAWFSQGFSNTIGHITPGGVVTTFALGSGDLVTGGDGAVWAAETDKIGRVPTTATSAADVTEYPAAGVLALTAGPDGDVYFSTSSTIEQMSTGSVAGEGPAGTIEHTWNLPSGSRVLSLTFGPGPDGSGRRIWYVDDATNSVQTLVPATGVVSSVDLSSVAPRWLLSIAQGPDGMYLTDHTANQIIRIRPAGTSFDISAIATDTGPYGITEGPDGNMWFTVEYGSNASGVSVPEVARLGIQPPTAVTEPATLVGQTSFTMNATVNPEGSPTHYAYQFGTDPTLATHYTTTGGDLPADEHDHTDTTASEGGLQANTTYYYRVIATNGNGGEIDGQILSVTLGTPVPPAPFNAAAPLITGTARVGSELTCSTGTWTNSPTSYAYSWLRGAQAVGDAATYTPVDADADQTLVCRVTASNAGGSDSATSAPVTPVGAVPTNLDPPAVRTTPAIGEPITCEPGTWSHNPTSYAYAWKAGTNVAGSGATYTPTADDAGQTLTCTVTATNSGGTSEPASVAVGSLPDRPLTLTPLSACASAGQPLRLVGSPSTCPSGSALTWNTATPGPQGPQGPPGADGIGPRGRAGQPGVTHWPKLHVYTETYFGTGRHVSGTVLCGPDEAAIGGGVAHPSGWDPHPSGGFLTTTVSTPLLGRGYTTSGARIRPIGWKGQVTQSPTPYDPAGPFEMVIVAYCVKDSA